MENILDKIINESVNVGIKLIIFVLILVIGFKLISGLIKLIQKNKAFNKLDKSVETFLLSGIKIVLQVILLMTALNYIGIPMTSMLAILGSCGLALGLALQGGLSNIAGGLMILIFKPFKIGDFIDTHTDSGTVKKINIFYTVLLTLDNREISLPNGPLSNSSIINYSAMDKRRVDLKYTVGYNSDISKVKKVINSIINKEKEILVNEENFIGLGEHGDNALIFYVRVWVKTEDYWKVYFDLNEKVKEEFNKNNIEIPYPQVDVHMKK